MITPILVPVPGIHGLRRDGALPTLLPFNSPRREAPLYEPRHRRDELHLNAEGAALFSHLFARRFARWLETGEEI